MNRFSLFLFSAAGAFAAAAPSSWLVDPAIQSRVGFDNNPIAVGGTAAPVLGERDALTFAAGLTFAVVSPVAADRPSGKLIYTGETNRYEGWSSEDYSTHRLAATGQATAGGWRLSGDASTLFVDGSRETYASLAACNANTTSLWRERRAQWQHRAKLLAVRDAGTLRIRLSATLLDYHYLTHVVAGRVAFADRRDLLGGVDAGWKQSAASFWFVGARAGRQDQDQVPLPGAAFDYSNHYSRLVAGWEGKLGARTTLALAAGPDFRHYDGTVDPKVFHDRDHTVAWFEASLAMKLSPTLSLTGKSTRWAWLSSTGKSAYTDFATEVALAWTIAPRLTLRATAKAHQCSYFPVVRNDWEFLSGLGLTFKASPSLQLTADVLDHRGWNVLPGVTDRSFTRNVLTVGATWKL